MHFQNTTISFSSSCRDLPLWFRLQSSTLYLLRVYCSCGRDHRSPPTSNMKPFLRVALLITVIISDPTIKGDMVPRKHDRRLVSNGTGLGSIDGPPFHKFKASADKGMKPKERKINSIARVLQCLSDSFVHCLMEASIQILSAFFVV